MGSIAISVDGACHDTEGRSYSIQATNVSAIIGGVVGAALLLLILAIVLARLWGYCGGKKGSPAGPLQSQPPQIWLPLQQGSPQSPQQQQGWPQLQQGFANPQQLWQK
jgi:hypothetical protein